MTPEQAEGLPGEENELPEEFVERLQGLVASKYTGMLQHIRSSWVFQQESIVGWQLMDFSMTKMKQLAHLAEDEEHIKFQGESETQKHAGLLLSLDLTLKQEEYEAAEIEDWSKKS
jgi:bacterioferritin